MHAQVHHHDDLVEAEPLSSAATLSDESAAFPMSRQVKQLMASCSAPILNQRALRQATQYAAKKSALEVPFKTASQGFSLALFFHESSP
eukprot:m.436459 g.436459  ORF g.436459 m.436459 type:complete len:89 (-) comp56773_c0_seq23:322-588(-)